MNQKGGVGKTTITKYVSTELAKRGYSVLVVDLDAQANLTNSFGVCHIDEDMEMYSEEQAVKMRCTKLSLKEMFEEKELHFESINENISLVPNCLEFSGMEGSLQQMHAREFVLRNLLKNNETKFDFIIIDCPPAVGNITINGLLASDYLIIPVTSWFAVKSLNVVLTFVEAINKAYGHNIKLMGTVMNMYSKQTNESKDMHKKLLSSENPHFETAISTAVNIKESERSNDGLKNQKIIGEFESLVTEILKKVR